MNVEILDQLRAYREHFEGQLPTVEAEDVIAERVGPEPVRPLRIRKPGGRRPRWAVALAAALVVLLLVGGVAWLTRVVGGRSAPVIDEPIPTTTPTEAVPGQWVRSSISIGADLDPELVNAVVAGGPGLVAVGRERVSFDEDTGVSSDRPTIWTSPDGLAWTRVPHDEKIFGTEGSVIENSIIDIAVGPFGLVAVGTSDGLPSIWTSEDGLTWERLPHDAEVFGSSTLERVIADSERVIVLGFGGQFVGSGPEPTIVVGEDGRPLDDLSDFIEGQRVWVSTDGETWARVSDDRAVFGGARIDPGAAAVGPTAVLVGGRCEVVDEFSSSCEPSVWLSEDAETWERHTRPGPDFAQVGVGDMVWFESQLVVVTLNPSAPVWTSPDGVAWTPIPPDESAFLTVEPEGEGEPAGPVRINGMAVGRDGLVAVGRGGDEQSGEVPAIWTSLDGISWTRVPHSEALFGPAGDGPAIDDIAAIPDGFVAVGDVIVDRECEHRLLSLCRARSAWVWRYPETGG